MVSNRVWLDGEIDLKVFFYQLWLKKTYLIFFIVIFFIIGLLTSSFSQTKWTNSIEIKSISALEYQKNILKLTSILSYLPNDKKIELQKYLTEKYLLDTYLNMYESPENKNDFIKGSSFFKSKIKSKDIKIGSEEYDKILSEIRSRITNNNELLSFTGDSKPNMLFLSRKYMFFINDKVQKYFIELQQNILNIEISDTEAKLKQIKIKIKSIINIDKEKLKFALDIAKSSGIKYPLQNMIQSDIFPYQLGSKAIIEKIKILNESSNSLYSIFSDYKTIEDRLNNLKSIKINNTKDMNIISEVFDSQYHIYKHSYKNIIIMLFVIVGMILGSLSITLYFICKENKGE
ncbi:Wzz/FepE/Etk N-terminal domain-containing protein [Photobacterium phosphoreum]|uniref:Wzz/FepE/Etk N-terminal domain-containing protein n=1 Tax=Photobacterium phosphoreum TaxID=659 RepID=UPI0024B972EF|nr:Wzz/FepE/Etk N-terminal domain-containing protein [Photobacterium phosphoreum]